MSSRTYLTTIDEVEIPNGNSYYQKWSVPGSNSSRIRALQFHIDRYKRLRVNNRH